MASFIVALLAIFLVIACGVPFLKVPGAAASGLKRCVKSSDCPPCIYGLPAHCVHGACLCLDDQKESVVQGNVDAICTYDGDCKKVCPPGCFANCLKGKCLCRCLNDQNESSLVDDSSDLSCFKSPDCHLKCLPDWTQKCVNGKCICEHGN